MENFFVSKGYISQLIPDFEERHEQARMADFILERLVESENSLVEAGTGTGKTLAYLVPSILFAVENGKKLYISTETRALQLQILEKEMPLLKKLFKKYHNMEFSYSLCLGSSNYACRKRFESVISRGKFHQSAEKHLHFLADMFSRKTVFTRFDIHIPDSTWNTINRDPDACNPYKCLFASSCPFQMARKEWASSDLLIMNHYLFFTNTASGNSYLPKADIAVFDEAHSIEDIASSQLGFSISGNQLKEILSRFYKRKNRSCLAFSIADKKRKSQCIELIEDISKESEAYFSKTRKILKGAGNQWRVRTPMTFGSVLVNLLKKFIIMMNDIEEDFAQEPLSMDFEIFRAKLFSFNENLISFVYMNRESFVYWIEKTEKGKSTDYLLRGQPYNIAEIMKSDVYSYYSSSILISATLSVSGDFSFFTERLGIHNSRNISIESSFDYKSQVILYANRNMPSPDDIRFIEKSSKACAHLIKLLKGNTLILFTSYSMLRETRDYLKTLINHKIYSQDSMNARDAIKKYINENNSVLMGTHSFWQGIDLPGDLLRGVIMMKLPFSVPSSPPVEARLEQIAEQGKNPFMYYQVPQAIIRFRQGFGRLIRSSKDKGIIALLDSRVLAKPYGKLFIKAIPECRIVYEEDELNRELKRLYR